MYILYISIKGKIQGTTVDKKFKKMVLRSFSKVEIQDAFRKLYGNPFHSFGAHTAKDLSLFTFWRRNQ